LACSWVVFGVYVLLLFGGFMEALGSLLGGLWGLYGSMFCDLEGSWELLACSWVIFVVHVRMPRGFVGALGLRLVFGVHVLLYSGFMGPLGELSPAVLVPRDPGNKPLKNGFFVFRLLNVTMLSLGDVTMLSLVSSGLSLVASTRPKAKPRSPRPRGKEEEKDIEEEEEESEEEWVKDRNN